MNAGASCIGMQSAQQELESYHCLLAQLHMVQQVLVRYWITVLRLLLLQYQTIDRAELSPGEGALLLSEHCGDAENGHFAIAVGPNARHGRLRRTKLSSYSV